MCRLYLRKISKCPPMIGMVTNDLGSPISRPAPINQIFFLGDSRNLIWRAEARKIIGEPIRPGIRGVLKFQTLVPRAKSAGRIVGRNRVEFCLFLFSEPRPAPSVGSIEDPLLTERVPALFPQ